MVGPRALLLGGPGRWPFNGQLRRRIGGGEAELHLCAAVAHGCPPPQAWQAARALGACFDGLDGRDRFALLRGAWERLAGLDPRQLGPAAGADLTLLLVALDGGGMGIAGTGLAALWALDGPAPEPLLSAEHPLLQLNGIPPRPPGVFAPARLPARVVAAARAGALDPHTWPGWAEACGLRVESRP